MNKEEKRETLQILQTFFAKSFVISFIFLLLASFMCILFQNAQLSIVTKYFPVDIKDYNFLLLLVFGIWKVIIIQFTLIPALVIWCMRKCCDCKCKN